MMLLSDDPTLADFAREDADLARRLEKLEKANSNGGANWPNDEKWSFTDYHGEVKEVEDPAGSRNG